MKKQISIKVSKEVKKCLDYLKQFQKQTYDEVIKKVLKIPYSKHLIYEVLRPNEILIIEKTDKCFIYATNIKGKLKIERSKQR